MWFKGQGKRQVLINLDNVHYFEVNTVEEVFAIFFEDSEYRHAMKIYDLKESGKTFDEFCDMIKGLSQ